MQTADQSAEPSPAANDTREWVVLARAAAHELAPPISAAIAFIAGLVLLNSAAQPALPGRLEALMQAWPLVVVELSHFMASVVGVFLILVSGGLWRRLDGAYWLALTLLVVGALFSLSKALDYEEAIGLAAGALILAPCHSAFFRRSELAQVVARGPWALGLVFALAAMVWIFLMSYDRTPYQDELWWTFLRDAEASRSIRAVAAAIVAGLLALGLAAIAPSRARVSPEALATMHKQAEQAFANAEQARGEANLIYLGEHDAVFTASGETLVLFRARGSHLIAMGDPIGKTTERAEALLQFHALADRKAANPVLYSVSGALLETVVDLGYAIRKIGESAVVDLATFSLDGAARAKLRNVRNKLSREGYVVTVAAPSDPIDWPALKRVSDAWLEAQAGREKAFSLGRFHEAYLARFPIVTVARAGEAPIAFANLWPTPDHGDIAVDLMRHAPDAPKGVMDFLFVEAILWAKNAGFKAFDLGMAPLSGLSASRYAPLMSKLGAAIFERAEYVYGFQGLRAYKQKFGPQWRPLFIAAPAHVSLPLALLDVGLLTAGGWLGPLKS
ncbi:MAG: phosphatidylglycerol lysyltransferase domain-containing protein [Caulobacterales bacterium]